MEEALSGFDEDEKDSDSKGDFDMLDQGLKMLDSNDFEKHGERLKLIFSDAYEYFVNYKKHGIG